MSFVTMRITFERELLPRRFTWLRHHKGWISCELPGADGDVVRAIHDVFQRWLTPIAARASLAEFTNIMAASKREWLDWTGSAFDVFGIDVSVERFLAGSSLEPKSKAIDGPDGHQAGGHDVAA